MPFEPTIVIQLLITAGLIAAIAAWAAFGPVGAPMLSRREAAAAGKILFMVSAVMLMVTLRNAIDLPAGQFIYGRF